MKTKIFLHNFRCTGNTMNLALKNFYPNDILKLGLLHEKMTSREDIIFSSKVKQPKFILGHNVYGLHHQLDFPCEYFINFREPINRLVSGYITWSATIGHSVQDYYADHAEKANGMTYRLLGFGQENGQWRDNNTNQQISAPPQIDAQLFEQAKANLNICSDILITEQFVGSQLLFEQNNNLPPLIVPQVMHFNQNFKFLTKSHLKQTDIDYLTQMNPWDIKLYQLAKDKLQQQIDSQDEAFHEQVRLRKIIADMLTVKGQDTLADSAYLKCIVEGFKVLLTHGMQSELVAITKLLLATPFSDNAQVIPNIAWVGRHLSTTNSSDFAKALQNQQ